MAKSKEELEKEIDRLLEQNTFSTSASIPYSDNVHRFYDSIVVKNKEEEDRIRSLEKLTAKAQDLKNKPDRIGAYHRTVGQIDTLQREINLDDVYRSERARTSFIDATNKAFSTEAIASDAAKFRQQTGHGEVHHLARQHSTSQLRERLMDASVDISQGAHDARSVAEQYAGTPNQKAEYSKMISERHKAIGKMSLIDQAMRAQKRMGLDIGSREESLEKFRGGFDRDRTSQEISKNIATGTTGSISQEMKKLEDAAAKVTKALDAMSKATDRSDENLEKLATSAEEARGEYERQKETVGQMRSGGGGGGGNGPKILATIGAGLSMAGEIGHGIFVNNPMAMTQNRIGQVNFANSRDDDMQAMGKGDMAAYRRIMTNQYSQSVKEGNSMRNTARVTTGLSAAGTFANGVAGAWEGAKTGMVVGAVAGAPFAGVGAGPGALIGGIGGAVIGGGSALASGTVAGHAVLNDVQADAIGLSRAQQTTELSNAVNAISDRANQGAMNYRLSNTYGTRGMSQENRNITMPLMEQQSTIDALKGLDMGDKAALLNYGVQAMGDRFGGQRGLDMMVQGNNMARAGGIVNNAQDFIGMAASLKGASGDENTIMRGIKVAFQEGMRGADVFKNLADSIAGLGNATAALGQKLTENFASRFASTSSEFTKMGYDAIQANAMAVSGISGFNAANTDRGLGLGNIYKNDAGSKLFGAPRGEIETVAQMKALHMNTEETEELNTLVAAVDAAPEGSSERNAAEMKLKQAQNNIGISAVTNKMPRGLMDKKTMQEMKKIEQKALAIRYFSHSERGTFDMVNKAIETQDFSGTVGSLLSGLQDESGRNLKGVFVGSSKDGSKKGTWDDLLSDRTKTAEETIGYMKEFDNKQVKWGIDKQSAEETRDAFGKVVPKYDGGKTYSDDAKQTAETGQLPTEQFTAAVERLNSILENYNKAAQANIVEERVGIDVFAEAAKSFKDKSAYNPLGNNSNPGQKK